MTDDIEQHLDRMSRESRKRVRTMIAESGRPDVLAEFDAKMKDIDSGLDGARRTWDALSSTQRALLTALQREGGHVWNDPDMPSRSYHSRSNGMSSVVRRATVTNLSRRGLLDWGAGSSPAGSVASLSERALFMLWCCNMNFQS